LGFPTTRKRSLENDQGVMPKDPTNTQNVSPTEDRAENVFLRVDIYPIITYI
jgi:hypothetical protein